MKCCVRSISNFQMIADMCNCFFASIFGKCVLVNAEKFMKRVYTSLLHLGQKSPENITAQKMKFSIKVFFSKSQFRWFGHIYWRNPQQENFIVCAVYLSFLRKESLTDIIKNANICKIFLNLFRICIFWEWTMLNAIIQISVSHNL